MREAVVDALLAVHNAGLVPFIPSQGSVGASGDLAPLAHLTLALIGEGEFVVDGVRRPAAEVLRSAGHRAARARRQGRPRAHQRHPGLDRARAACAASRSSRCSRRRSSSARSRVDAARGSDGPFDPRIHALRGQPGQIDVARYYRALLAGSEIRRSHLQGDDRVQDPYSLRCQPQVVGACLDQLRHAALVLVREANAVTDNPLVFAADNGADGAIVSGGNFHAEPVALAADAMAVAIAEVGAIAERRIAMLIDAGVSRLPPFLAAEPGLNSGFMIAHVTAASLASENKSLAHPASVDSLPTSANQEDHVSMATFAARRLQPMIANTAHILAHRAARRGAGDRVPAPARQLAAARGRARAAARGSARRCRPTAHLAPDIERASALVRDGSLARVLRTVAGLPALWQPA